MRDAHSLYLETPAELGLVGLALAARAARLRRRGRAPRRGARYAGPVAALAAFALHAGVDWDWELPALTLVALVLAGLVLSYRREPERGSGCPSPMSTWLALRRGTASPDGSPPARSSRTKNALTPASSVCTSR